MSLILHPHARTRALYRWEENHIYTRDEDDEIELDAARYLVKRTWERFPSRRPLPFVTWGFGPCAYGYTELHLGILNHRITTVIHEIAHIRGFGTPTDIHSIRWVRAYCHLLSWWFRWDEEELLLLARDYKLC